MTEAEARAKAVRRWGDQAYIAELERADGLGRPRYYVGCVDPVTTGIGESWEEAFAAAIGRE
jgi:hypothetical protein